MARLWAWMSSERGLCVAWRLIYFNLSVAMAFQLVHLVMVLRRL
jgi:hypothetical protein